MSAPDEVKRLVENFDRHIDKYKDGTYNETQVRVDYLDPLFIALGWDVHNEKGYAEAYREVSHEFSLKVGTSTTAPDYCFKIGQEPKFFLEAKKPSVPLKDANDPAFQLRRYAWSAKLPLSILSDFEEFAVYDCRIRPVKTDRSSKARVQYITYTDYVEQWDEIEGLFSPEAIKQGAFDRFVESNKKKRGTAEVDDAFLQEIEAWREVLAKNIRLRNPDLDPRHLNEAVQATIDRIIFLRICEDRGIEPYGRLRDAAKGKGVYGDLVRLFHQADARYNSGLFHFEKEKGRPEADTWTLDLKIDDQHLKDILKKLYYPDSPYEFSVLPADILGQVYEQFLGKVITPRGKTQVTIEDKPEVKKAGGVYYTPTYIVDYIVEHTVGKLLEDKSPEEVMGKGRKKGTKHPLRVLDPACGSGTFLIGAYQFLLDWYLDRYAKNPDKYTKGREPRIYEGDASGRDHDYRLTTNERKRILLDHIYGVDIDPQAVEVTKLSLLLKVLEGESKHTIENQLDLFHQRALPDLAGNIKCGNSLIGPDFYDQPDLDLTEDEERRINAFDWKTEFPDVFKGDNPGFDAVIGNPPYIRIQNLQEWNPKEARFYRHTYESGSEGNFDIYVVFVERGASLLNDQGYLGFICPSKFFGSQYGRPLRRLLTHRNLVEHIVDFGHEQVFETATTYTCLLILATCASSDISLIQTRPEALQARSGAQAMQIARDDLDGSPWVLVPSLVKNLMGKMEEGSVSLSECLSNMSRGISTGADSVFTLQVGNGHLETKAGAKLDLEEGILVTPIYAEDYSRYRFHPVNRQRLIFPYLVNEASYQILPEDILKSEYPKAHKYLADQKRTLARRKGGSAWYGFSAPRNLHVHRTADLFVPLLANRGSSVIAPSQSEGYCLMAGAGFSLRLKDESGLTPEVLLGLVNSTLLHWYLSRISSKFRGGWVTCTKQYFTRLPIRLPSHSNSADISEFLSTVETILVLYKRLDEVKSQHDRTQLQRRIEATDRQIDRLVYELYGLTDAEIKIVEEATAG